mgnify:FL=1
MQHRARFIPLATLTLALLAACQGQGPAAALAQSQQTAKINAYVDCYNGVGQPVQESMEEYASWIADLDTGPTGKERQMRGPRTVLSHRVAACGEPMTAALQQQPADPVLDPAARQFQQAFQAVNEKIEEASRYYAREDYKRDGGAGMKRLHGPLMAAFSTFHTASAALSEALDVKEDERRQQQLAQVEKDEGRSITYYQLRVLGEGKQLVQVLGAEPADPAAAQAQMQVFQQVLEQAEREKIGKDDPMWGHVQRSADALLRQAGRRMERLTQDEQASRSEELLKARGIEPQGSQAAVLDAYNDLVEMSNRRSR